MTRTDTLPKTAGATVACGAGCGASVPYYIRACVLGIPAYLIGIHLWTWIWTLPVFLGGQADFRRLYASGYMVRAGYARFLYDAAARFAIENRIVGPGVSLGFDHPAYETLLFVPFSYVSYRAAYFLFLAFNLGLLAACFLLLQPWMQNLRRVYIWLPYAIFLAFLPVCAVLIQGQDSILLLLFMSIALRFLDTGRDFLAGLILGVGFFKFQIVIPIAALFLLWKHWRFMGGFITTSSVAIAGSILLVGTPQSMLYLKTLAGMSVHSGSAVDRLKYFLIPTAMPNIRGLVFGAFAGWMPNFWIQLLTILLSVVSFFWVARAARLRERGDALLIAILTAGLVSYHFLIHDVVVLLLPVLIVLDRFIFAEPCGRREEKFKLHAAALLFTAPVLMGWFPGHFYLAIVPLLLLLFLLARTEQSSADRGVTTVNSCSLQSA
jgi:glycosyl transferase family 87